ncbi:ATPase [Pedobacter yulinensis]|uniref:ATPase n=1 Tax=Pedobacter yulinensis TaxID=2126353 RepID=A0A2T3HNE6_9SPHI|nr:SRPBCC domain-containing protein [Pedobacter yulinensis]PST83913.1 ATPase [Pedobacter yulinensis]
MEKTDFSTTILVDQTPDEVFEAIIEPRKWWSGDFNGNTKELGAEFTYNYRDIHCTTQKVTELVPGQKVVWLVTDSQLNFLEDKQEWKGTEMIFQITPRSGQTALKFTHVGIHPGVECYDACSGAWGMLIRQSLHNLIATGKSDKPDLT